nr:RNA-directed DNA polymerase, eukaryota [Tanacetum cinerariifolium]
MKLFQDNVSIGSWFSQLKQAYMEFNTEGRIAWVEVEGILFKLWSDNTFKRIATKWGELLDIDDQDEMDFWIRAKEASRWVPDFMQENEDEEQNDDGGFNVHESGSCGGDSNVEGVLETIFEESRQKENNLDEEHMDKQENHSGDPFSYTSCSRRKKTMWINSEFDGRTGEGRASDGIQDEWVDSVGNSGGILCVWDPNSFRKSNATVSDYFIMIWGVWRQTGNDLLIITVYAPHDLKDKQMLWDYLTYEIGKWKGEVVIMGDFNKVRYKSDRFGSVFNVQGANVFNSFITNARLEEVPLAKYKDELEALETIIDKGDGNVKVVNKTMEVVITLQKIDKICSSEMAQKEKVKWSIEGDEKTSFFHGCNSSFIALILKIPDANTINMSKSKIMGVLVDSDKVKCATLKLGCLILKTPFSYLGSKVGGSMSRVHTWNEVVDQVKNQLSKWKMKTLSIGGRLTLLNSVRVFDISGHTLLFERSDFCLVTGFACGKVVFLEYMDDGITPFLRRVFLDKAKNLENKASLGKSAQGKAAKGKAAKGKAAKGKVAKHKAAQGKAAQPSDKGDTHNVTILDLRSLIWDDEKWKKLSVEDSIRDSNPITQIRLDLKKRYENLCRKTYDYVACKERSEQMNDRNGFTRDDETEAEQDRSGASNRATSGCDDIDEVDAAADDNAKDTSVHDDVGVPDAAIDDNEKAMSVCDDIDKADAAADDNVK